MVFWFFPAVNKERLLIRLHYFIHFSGLGPIVPFLLVMVKDLGFTSLVLGSIFTVVPLILTPIKILLGGIADKFQSQKIIFLLLMMAECSFFFGIYWIPHLPEISSSIVYDDGFKLKICSPRFDNVDLTSMRTFCKVDCSKINGTFEIEINGNGSFMNGDCVYIPAKMDDENHKSDNITSNFCKTACKNSLINEILSSTSVPNKEIYKHYQFWLLFLFIVMATAAKNTLFNFSDTICLNLLGASSKEFGQMRLWGALGWGSTCFLTGILVIVIHQGKDNYYTTSFCVLIICTALNLIISSNIQFKFTVDPPKNLIKDVYKVINNKPCVLFMLCCVSIGFFTAFEIHFAFWVLEEIAANNGGSKYIKALELFCITVDSLFGEVPMFFLSSGLIQRIGRSNSLTLVLGSYSLICLYISYLTNPWWILPEQLLSGMTYALIYTVLPTYAPTIAPPGAETTVQILINTAFDGLGASLGGLIGGYLIYHYGGVWASWYAGVAAAFLAILHAFLHRIIMKEKKSSTDL